MVNKLQYKKTDEQTDKKLFIHKSSKDDDIHTIDKSELVYRRQQFRIISSLTTALITFINRTKWFIPRWTGVKGEVTE